MRRTTAVAATRRRRLVAAIAAVATAMGVAAIAIVATPATAAGTSTLVGGFESDAERWWATGTAAASFARVPAADAPEGSQVGQVQLTDTVSGLYEIVRPLPLAVGSLSFAIKAPDLERIVVRLIDATGRAHQTEHILDATEDWQVVTMSDPTAGDAYIAWGGVDGAGWQDPAVQLSLLVDTRWVRDPRPAQATIQVDDVRVVSPAVPTGPLTLSQTTVGNVVVGDAPVTIGYSTTGDALRWTLRDASGTTVGAGELADPGPDGVLPLDVGPGWYSLTVQALADGAVIATESTTLAKVAGHTAAEDSPFGVATHYAWDSWTTDSVPLVTAAGLGTVRDEVSWSSLEQQRGVYDWSVAAWTDVPTGAGLDLLLIPGYGNPHYDGGDKPTSPEAIAAYSAYAAALAERYQDVSAGIEIWNEWDLSIGNTTAGSPEAYVELLRAAAPAVRDVAPGLPIIGPAVAMLSTDWLERTFQLGALDYVDGIVLHAYSYPAPAEALDATLTAVDALVRQYNDGEPIPLWVTEHGWPTGSNVRAITEAGQASNLTKSAAIAAAHGVGRYVWYDLQNDGVDDANTENNFGLIHHPDDELGGLTPKPAYVAYATATSFLDDVTFVGRDQTIDSVWQLTYASGAGDPDLRVLWAEQDESVGIRSGAPFTVTTQYGAATAYPATGDGAVVLQLDDEPVYVSGVVEAVAADASALTIDEAFVGQPITVRWTADNTAGTAGQEYVLTVDGLAEPVVQTVAAGETGTLAFTLAAPAAAGPVRVVGELSVDGDPRGVLSAEVDVQKALALTGTHTIDQDGAQTLRLRLSNRAAGSFTVDGIDWTIGDAAGQDGTGAEVVGGSALVVDVPLGDLAERVTWSATARVAGHDDLTAAGVVAPVGDVTDAGERRIAVDGVLDDLAGLSSVTFGLDEGVLEATAWYTWDADALYLSAAVTDDVHHQRATGGNIWQGDSLQLTFVAGAPGEELRTYNEIGVALTPEGSELYRWLPAGGTGSIPGAQVAVTRDDAASLTVYEVALPWSSLGGWDPGDGLFGSSLAINENDGAGRTWAEWGGGIVRSKDPSLFNAVRLVPAPPAPEWDPGATYLAGDLVSYQGAEFLASWWTRNQEPGNPWGPWQEIVTAPDGTAVWTPSRIFGGGDEVLHDGVRYVAQWWTRNQEPAASPWGPWRPTA